MKNKLDFSKINYETFEDTYKNILEMKDDDIIITIEQLISFEEEKKMFPKSKFRRLPHAAQLSGDSANQPDQRQVEINHGLQVSKLAGNGAGETVGAEIHFLERRHAADLGVDGAAQPVAA